MSSRHKFCREALPVYQVTHNEQHTSYGFHATVAAMSQGLVDLEDAYEQYAYCSADLQLRCPNTLFTGDFYRNRTQLVQLVGAVQAAGVEAGIERASWKRWNDDTVSFRNEMQALTQVAGWAGRPGPARVGRRSCSATAWPPTARPRTRGRSACCCARPGSRWG